MREEFMTGGTKHIIDCIMIAESGINLIFFVKSSLESWENTRYGDWLYYSYRETGFSSGIFKVALSNNER